MRQATRWFNKRVTQDVRTNVSQLPILAVYGPNIQSKPDNKQNGADKPFQVGVSEVGGEEVVV